MASPLMVKGCEGGPGRPPGMANKVTTQAREAIARFADGNALRCQVWLDQIAETSPLDAFRCYMMLLEYHVPKLNRTEVTGPDAGPIVVKWADQ